MAALFRPEGSATLAATTTSSNVALPGAFSTNAQSRSVRLYNAGPSEAFVRAGDGTVTVTAGGAVSASPDGYMCIPPGVVEVFGFNPFSTHLAAITASGTALLRITTGEGQ